jgi:hypothetical protein
MVVETLGLMADDLGGRRNLRFGMDELLEIGDKGGEADGDSNCATGWA